VPQFMAKQILVHSQTGIRKYVYLTDSKKLIGASRRQQVFPGILEMRKVLHIMINFQQVPPLA
jgi:hypothetical protein